MKTVSDLYYRTKQFFFYRDYNDEEYVRMESQGFEDYLTDIEKENKSLKHRNINLEKAFNDVSSQNDRLESEIKFLNDKYEEQYRALFKVVQENANMDKHIKELETDLGDYRNIQDKQQEQLEDAMLYGEDNPYYVEKYHPKLYEEVLKNERLQRQNKNLNDNVLYLSNEVGRQENEIFDLFDKNEKLETENKELSDENYKLLETNGYLNSTIEKLEEENIYLKNYNKMLENANFNLKLTKDILETKVEDLSQQKEINDILETDKPLSSNELLVDKIDKLEEKNDTYKEVVKAMCDKYEIPKESVIEIIETVQSNKSQQLEKTL
jgi:hypothetical protein